MKKLEKIDDEIEFVKVFGKKGDGNGEFKNPSDVDFDSNGNIYILDWKNHRIQKLDSKFNFIQMIGKKGKDKCEFDSPHSIFIGKNNMINLIIKF